MRRHTIWLLALALAISPLAAFAADPAPSASAAKSDAPVSQAELQEMKALLRAQAERLEQQRILLEQEQEKVRALSEKLGITDVAVTTNTASPALVRTAATSSAAQGEKPKETSSPLFFRIGDARFTPGGFVGYETVFRTNNVSLGSGNNTATSFGTVPFNNTLQGNLTEFRAQDITSRLSMRVDVPVGQNKVMGFVEGDFTGNQPASIYITTNSDTFRLRQYYVDVTRNKWEFTGGQAWTMLTPARKGLGLLPQDLMITQVADANYHVGLYWARQPQFRVAYHPTDHWVVGLSVENPEQFVGPANEILFPASFTGTQLTTQFDALNNPVTPNLHPDFILKLAHDQKFAGNHNWHFEVAGIARSFRVGTCGVGTAGAALSTPCTAGIPVSKDTITGGGVSAGTIVEAFKNFNLLAYGYWSDGGGRYMNGAGPDVVLVPVVNSTTTTVNLSPVHSGSGIAGFEWQTTPKYGIFGYYGAYYAERNAFPDVTGVVDATHPACIGSVVAHPCIGFGGAAAAGTAGIANRAIQEGSVGFSDTLFKSPNYGALQLVTQGAYLTRSPWFVPKDGTGTLLAPKNAHVAMVFVTLRYVLP